MSGPWEDFQTGDTAVTGAPSAPAKGPWSDFAKTGPWQEFKKTPAEPDMDRVKVVKEAESDDTVPNPYRPDQRLVRPSPVFWDAARKAGGEQTTSATESFNTPLTPDEETEFQTWKDKYAPNDSGADYDLRGAFKAGLTPDENHHWPDTFKKPGHPTFSDESIYAPKAPALAGHWEGENFMPSAAQRAIARADVPKAQPEVATSPLIQVRAPQSAQKEFLQKYGTDAGYEYLTTPLWDYLPDKFKKEFTPLEFMRQAAAKDPSDEFMQAVDGIAEGLGETGKSFTSPVGIMTMALPVAKLPAAMQKVVQLGFAAQMARTTPELFTQLGDEWGKPPEQRDLRRIFSLATEGAANTGFSAWLGMHGLSPARGVAAVERPQAAPIDVDALKAAMEFNPAKEVSSQQKVVSSKEPQKPPSSIQPGVGKAAPGETSSEVLPVKGAESERSEWPEYKPRPETLEALDAMAALRKLYQQEAAGGSDVPSPEQSAEPAVATQATVPPAAPQVKRVARGLRARKVFESETALNGPDILSWIADRMLMMSKSAAKSTRGKEWWGANQSLYDDAAPMQRPQHNIIYGGKSMPDQVAQAAFEAGVLKSPDVNELWTRIRQASNARAKAFEQQAGMEKALQGEMEEAKRWNRATANKQTGLTPVTPEELKVGDHFLVDDETVRVSAKDQTTGEVTLEDGKKFGVQKAQTGQTLYVETLGEEPAAAPVKYPEHKAGDALQPFETAATAGRLDNLAQAVHGRGYAELEDWQQDAIRQAVEAGTKVPGRQPAPAIARREPAGGREPVPAGTPAAKPAGQLSAAPTGRTPSENISIGSLKAGDRIRFNGYRMVVESWTPDPVLKRMGVLRLHLEGDPSKSGAAKLDGKDPLHYFAGKFSKAGAPETGQTALREEPGRIEAMGGGAPKSAVRVAAEASAKATRAGQEAAYGKEIKEAGGELGKAVETEVSGAIGTSRPTTVADRKVWFAGIRAAFNPMSLGDSARETATVLRYVLGKQFVNEQRFDQAMSKFRSLFDKRTTPRAFKYEPERPLPPNWELQRAIDSGDVEQLTPAEKDFAGQMRKMFDAAIAQIQKFKPDALQDLHESYFPRAWRDQDEQAARFLAQAHRPWAGPKTFLKPRTLALWEDALKRGLKPRDDNPVDAVYNKLSEMWRFAGALEAHQILKTRGVRRFRYIFERAPDGWTSAAPNDPGTKVYAPPTVTIKEAYDEQIRTKTREMFRSLGIVEERLANIGGKRWGYAREGTRASPEGYAGQGRPGEKVVTKFGGADFVFWHEFGHIMDFRFPDLRAALGASGSMRGRSGADAQLRALADLRGVRPGYAHKAEEKMANVFDAYVRAPELLRKAAPTVYQNLTAWLERHPEVKGPLNDIRPSLKLGQGQTEMFVGGPVLLGEWIMPEPAARVLQNYLNPGVWGKSKSLGGIKQLGGMMSSVRLISLFHGQMVSNDALASGLSLPLYDAMKAVADRNPALLKRGLRDLPLIPARPIMALVQGGRILRAIRDPNADVGELDKQLAQYAIEGNLRAGHYNATENATRRWKEAIYEAMNVFRGEGEGRSLKAAATAAAPPAWEALWRTPLMVTHEMMRPVMQWFVPRMKYGLQAPMLMRIVADNPGADVWTLRRKFGQAANDVEDRVGQVTYDNMFLSRAIKDSGQLGLQAFGWHATKERMAWGAASDYFKAGKALLQGQRPEITFRMTYLPSMVMTHALIGGTIMYMLTGRRPKKLVDYIFPETGLIDAYGQPVRMALADFLKDYLGEWNAAMHGPKAVITEWERRLLPVWNNLADMYRDRDFWNTKIFSERQFDEPEWQHLWSNLKEGSEYLGGSNLPFSYKGAARFTRELPANPTAEQKALATVGPYLGFVPAPLFLTQTPAQAKAAEISRASLPPMTKGQMQHVKLVGDLVHDLRTGKINGDGELVGRIRMAGVKDTAELTRIKERVLWTPLQYQIHKLPLLMPGSGADAMSVWDLMNKEEKTQTAPVFMAKIQRAYEGGKLDPATTGRLVKTVMPYLVSSQQPAVSSGNANRLRSAAFAE